MGKIHPEREGLTSRPEWVAIAKKIDARAEEVKQIILSLESAGEIPNPLKGPMQ